MAFDIRISGEHAASFSLVMLICKRHLTSRQKSPKYLACNIWKSTHPQ